jgi:hypothetical protein
MGNDESHERLKRMLDEALLLGNEDSVHNLFNSLNHHDQAENIAFDGPALLEYWWGLARSGIIAVPGSQMASVQTFGMPGLSLPRTDGREREASIHGSLPRVAPSLAECRSGLRWRHDR